SISTTSPWRSMRCERPASPFRCWQVGRPSNVTGKKLQPGGLNRQTTIRWNWSLAWWHSPPVRVSESGQILAEYTFRGFVSIAPATRRMPLSEPTSVNAAGDLAGVRRALLHAPPEDRNVTGVLRLTVPYYSPPTPPEIAMMAAGVPRFDGG